jgi:aryl-alcohol dehydrogenase-like predicted oxidoreductase
MLIRTALGGRRDRVVLSVKFGALRGPDGAWLGFDARPSLVKAFAAYSLKRLGVDVIDIYRPSRLDPKVPIEDTIGAIADLVKAGYVRHIGLSEVGVDTIRRAHATHPIVDLQIEYSLASRGPEAKLFPVLDELGISSTLYGVFSRGLLTGSKPRGNGDFRSFLPRFNGANAEKNALLVAEFESFARKRETTPARLAVAWVRAKRPNDVALLGVKTRAQLDGAFSADAFADALMAADVTALDALIAPDAISGTRYGEEQMRHLDSER